jgi:hypothetical protein
LWALNVYTGSQEPAVFIVCLVYINTETCIYCSLHRAVWGVPVCRFVYLFQAPQISSFLLTVHLTAASSLLVRSVQEVPTDSLSAPYACFPSVIIPPLKLI